MSPPDHPEIILDPPTPSDKVVAPHPVDQASRSSSPQLLQLELPADPIVAAVTRDELGQWLTALGWPADQGDDIVLAVSEAVSNATEHAYLDQAVGLVTITGELETTPDGQRRVTVVVRDHGRWRPIPMHHDNRRRGIPIMQACMDSVTIGHSADQIGTWVVLRSNVVPPA
jgi:anti-sigma regulatory factor (Ser/Thr protein kinase)